MNFDLDQDQELLSSTAASFVKRASPPSRVRKLREDPLGYSPDLWRQMAEMGWLGMLFPESAGGLGRSFVDVSLVLEHLGASLVPEPFVPSVILGGLAIARAGSAEQHQKWLAPLIEGRTTLALAHDERDSRFSTSRISTRAERDGDGYRLHGEKVFVLNGHAADSVVVSALAPAGLSLFVVDRGAPGLKATPVSTIDGRRAALLALDGVRIGADRRLGAEGQALPVLDEVMDVAAAAACAEGVGVARAMLQMTLEHLKTREQFNTKIGSFQVLQHRAVDMFIETELARSITIAACIKADDKDPVERRAATSAAKAQLAISGRFVAYQAIQLHGGIGITDEHDIGLYFKRMQALNTLFGDEDHHVAQFAALSPAP
ncbi:MAG TPA: acyl-CoA dehydrogenase family protein [Myxococcaceae bacterium]|jgi:alkylation response protein AidB-like acyl-CoA dehydrogenase